MNRAWPAIFPIALLPPLIFHWLPLWRRNGIWFGVTVAPGYTDGPEARTVLHRFRIAIWLLALAAISVTVLGPPAIFPWALPAAMTLEIVGALAAFVHARRQTLPHALHPSPVRSVSLMAPPEGLPGGAAAALVPFAILGAGALYLYLNWSRIPERFPVHWGIDGSPDGWNGRTWQGVYTPLLLGAVHCGLMLLIALGVLRASPRGRVAANAAASAQLRRVMLQFLVAAVWGMALLLAVVSLAPLLPEHPLGNLPPILISFGLLALAIPFVWRLIRIGRTIGSGGDGTPDQCWKLGIFYFNPADAAIFVEKRFGIGYTCNFANRTTWLFLGLLFLFSLVPVLLRYL
jgi:uncharacterized membrane protein